jgi:hypothetical protein
MNRSFNDDEIKLLWEMFNDDHPDASRATKSQTVKKWKTGTYVNSINANAIVIKYITQQEQDKRETDLSDWADEITKEIDEEYKNIGIQTAKITSELATIDRNKIYYRKQKEANEKMREVIKLFRLELRQEKGEFEYDNWVSDIFNREDKSYFGL